MALQETSTDKNTIAAIRDLFAQAKALYAPEGDYMKGVESGLERGRGKAIAGGMQGLASAGLANTSMMGGLAGKYEEEVAAPTRASATSNRLAALSGLMGSEASALASTATRTSFSSDPIQPASPAFPKSQPSTVARTSQPVSSGNDWLSSYSSPSFMQESPAARAPSSVSLSGTYNRLDIPSTSSLVNSGSLYGPTPSGGNVATNVALSKASGGLSSKTATPMQSLLSSYGW